MAETRWTKGPWEIHPRARTNVRQVGTERSVANCGGYARSDVDTTPENEANTRLVSVAPNLYARLARRVTNCGCVLGDGVRCLECEADREVLAKARGEGAPS